MTPLRAPRPRRLASRGAAFAAYAALAAACAAGPTFDGRVYRSAPVTFELRAIPKTYERVELEGAAVAFRDATASVLVGARCGLRSDDAPLEALTNHLLIGTTERAYAEEAVVPFDGREARFTRLTAKLDGVPRAYAIYVLKKDGCVFDFVRVAPAEDAEGVEAFKRFASSFRLVATGAVP